MEAFELWFQSAKEAIKTILVPLKEIGDIISRPSMSFGIIGVVFLAFFLVCIVKYGKRFKNSLKKPRTLVVLALLMAMNVVLGIYTIRISDSLRVGFGFVTQPVVALLFGPVACCITGMIQDVLVLLINPTGAYIPAYTLSVGLCGMFYGLMYYRKSVSLGRVFAAQCLVMLVGNVIFNSIALAPTVGSGFIGILPARIIKNILLLLPETFVVFAVLKFMKTSGLYDKFRA